MGPSSPHPPPDGYGYGPPANVQPWSPGPPFYAPHRRPTPPLPRTDGRAVAALCLGLLSMSGLGALTGLPAIILGATTRKEIDRAGGALTGKGLAAAGAVAGLFGTGIGFVVLLYAAGAMLEPLEDTKAAVPKPALTEPAPNEQPAALPPGVRAYGTLEVVDLDRSRPLRGQLKEALERAKGRTVILQTFFSGSRACDDIAQAMDDSRMQDALANVTLVRVDAEEYRRELHGMRVETLSAPWFYKIDAKGQPTDAISADAWDANIPENMAPVLGLFVRRNARD